MKNSKKYGSPTLAYLLVAGAIIFLIHRIAGRNKSPRRKQQKRIFISFAIEDEKYRNYLVRQSKNKYSPFTFVDMSVKKPWAQNIWKKKCRRKIKSCDGLLVLLSGHTISSNGSRWEINCAGQEKIPVAGMHIKKTDKQKIPPELFGQKVITWSWENLASYIEEL